MPNLQTEFCAALQEIEYNLGPNGTANTINIYTGPANGTYNCIASVGTFERVLDTGGFITDRMLNLTVKLYDNSGNTTFVNGYPQPQNLLTYSGDNNSYRIISTKLNSSQSFIRILAECTTRGI